MSGVGISGLIANLSGTITPYPTQDPALELGGYRSVLDVTARNAIPANFRAQGMIVTTTTDGTSYQLIGGILDANWTPVLAGSLATVIRASLADLVASDLAGLPNGCRAYVLDQGETYTLDTANTFAAFSPLIIARGVGTGRWFRRSKAYVVGNFTLWCCPFGGSALGGSGDSKIRGFTPGQVTASNANPPDIILDLAAAFPTATITILDVLTDGLGNLWVTGMNAATTAGTIQKFALRDCLGTGAPASQVSIAFTVPNGASIGEQPVSAFDKQNNLWLGLGGRGTFGVAAFVKYNQTTYALGGSPTPDVTISIFNPGSFQPSTSDLASMCFDSAGNMWAGLASTNGAFAGGILMLPASQLNVSNASLVPAVFWQGSNLPHATFGLRFDSKGMLWALSTSGSGSSLFSFDPRSPVTGNQAPLITITSTTFNLPVSLDFDASGNLWTMNDNNALVYRLPAASLAASGAVVPDVILSGTGLVFGIALTFPNNPNRSGLLAAGIPVTP